MFLYMHKHAHHKEQKERFSMVESLSLGVCYTYLLT